MNNRLISAGLRGGPAASHRDLGNRRSIRLSYGGNGGFPSFLRGGGQSIMRETRDEHRFTSAQEAAQSVPGPFASDILAEIARLSMGVR